MSLVQQNFWSQILWISTKSKSPGGKLFGKLKVIKLDSTILADKNMFRFEIPVDNILAVEILENLSCLGSVKSE